MKKNFVALVVFLIVCLGVLCIQEEKYFGGSKYQIAYFDTNVLDTEDSFRKLSKQTDLHLVNKYDVYVLNKSSFNRLVSDNVQEFLNKKGLIIVNDNSVTGTDVRNKLNMNFIDFDYHDSVNQYGFYIYNNGFENVIVNVALGFLEVKQDSNLEIVEDVVEKEVIVESIADSAMTKMATGLSLEFEGNNDSGGGSSPNSSNLPTPYTNTTGQVIASCSLQNFLYVRGPSNSHIIDYTINTEVVDVLKAADYNTNYLRGVYDVITTYYFNPLSDYKLLDYTCRMRTFRDILDASYLYSQDIYSFRLGGTINFDGVIVQGSYNTGINHYYYADFQDITNDLDESEKYWSSTVTNTYAGEPKSLTTGIRVQNYYDVYPNDAYSRVEELRCCNNVFFLFQKTYYLLDEYRKELCITWDAEGFIRQSTYEG